MVLESIIGLGILAFLFTYMAFQLDEKHVILKIFMFVFAILLMFVLSKVSYESMDFCEIMPRNSTIIGNTTSYYYTRECFSNPDQSGLAAFKLMNYFVRIFNWYIYLVMFLMLLDIFKVNPWNWIRGWFK